MKYFIRPAYLLLGLSLLAAPALAQEFRLGFVSLDRIIKEAVPAKNAQAKLEQEFSKREKELQTQGASIKGMADQLEREAPTLSESQRVNRQKQLVELDRDFQRKRREFQEDLNARRNEELQQVFERANRVVKQVADAEKYDLILQEAVYVNPRHDITDKVIKALNATVTK
ncbi:MAG: OmpH family outer membrane protein [Burkholderiales bacterium]|jgi:outer membrane protein|nr:OmpH family outer membrane protein [Burkholderiales bacterium]MCZ8295113.1 OmpH family outer membrane protein [Hylemonella sp.]